MENPFLRAVPQLRRGDNPITTHLSASRLNYSPNASFTRPFAGVSRLNMDSRYPLQTSMSSTYLKSSPLQTSMNTPYLRGETSAYSPLLRVPQPSLPSPRINRSRSNFLTQENQLRGTTRLNEEGTSAYIDRLLAVNTSVPLPTYAQLPKMRSSAREVGKDFGRDFRSSSREFRSSSREFRREPIEDLDMRKNLRDNPKNDFSADLSAYGLRPLNLNYDYSNEDGPLKPNCRVNTSFESRDYVSREEYSVSHKQQYFGSNKQEYSLANREEVSPHRNRFMDDDYDPRRGEARRESRRGEARRESGREYDQEELSLQDCRKPGREPYRQEDSVKEIPVRGGELHHFKDLEEDGQVFGSDEERDLSMEDFPSYGGPSAAKSSQLASMKALPQGFNASLALNVPERAVPERAVSERPSRELIQSQRSVPYLDLKECLKNSRSDPIEQVRIKGMVFHKAVVQY